MKRIAFLLTFIALPFLFAFGSERPAIVSEHSNNKNQEALGIPIDIDIDLGGGCRIRAVGDLGIVPLRFTGTITITGPCQGTYNVDGVSGPAVGTGNLSEEGLISNFYFESSDSQFKNFINSDLIRLAIISELERAIAEN